MARAILFDSTLCVGCRACEEACAERWEHPYDERIAAEERLSERKLTAVRTVGESYLRKMCMHCAEPSCASACPVGALQKTSLGPVVYDAAKCMGCRYCMTACPFQAPSYTWNARLPVVKKCDACYERQRRGQPTACTEACAVGATIGGDRDELIAEARKRIAENPGQYVPHILWTGGSRRDLGADVVRRSLRKARPAGRAWQAAVAPAHLERAVARSGRGERRRRPARRNRLAQPAPEVLAVPAAEALHPAQEEVPRLVRVS